jgi:hypothetical protein
VAGSTLGLKRVTLLVPDRLNRRLVCQPELFLLSKVDSQAKEGYTAVSWEREYGTVPEDSIANPSVYVLRRKTALFPYVAGAVFRRTDLGWAPTNIGLPPKAIQAAAADGEGRLYAGIEQAVYSSSDRGDSWRPVASGLLPKDVHAVATGPSGIVAVGSADSGVHVSNDGGESWSPLSGPGEVEIPTGWRRFIESVRYKLPKTNIRSLLFADKKKTGLLAGSDDGVFGYDARRDSWVSMNEHLPDLDRKKGTAPLAVRALAAVEGGKRILAGTDKGVFLVEALFNGPSSAVLSALLVLLLPGTLNTILPDFLNQYSGLIYMLLPIGVLIVLLLWQQPFRQKWVGFALAIELYVILGLYKDFIDPNLVTELLIYLTVFLLAVIFLALNVLQAGLAKLPGSVQKLPDWVKRFLPGVFDQAKQPKVFSLLVVGLAFYAGTDHGVYRLDKQNWKVRFIRWWRQLVLGPQPESWTVVPGWYGVGSLSDPSDQVVTALASDTHGYLLAGTLAGNLYEWKPETTQTWVKVDRPLTSIRAIVTAKDDVFAMGAPLDAPQEVRWAPAQLDAGAVDLDALSLSVPAKSFAAAIDGNRSAVFLVTGAVEQASHDAKQAGQLTRLKIGDLTIEKKKELSGFDRATTQFYCQSERLAIFDDQFLPHPVQGKEIVLAGRVTGLEEDKVMLVSGKTPAGQPRSEPITIMKVEPHETTTTVQLKESLASVYDRDSVTIYGNIASAIQGQTIRNESLGESDGTIPNQRFLLRSPLAYEPAAASDYTSSLVVRVNQIQWNQVPTLLDQPAGARVYMVRRNDQGQTAVIFGDGEQGARLPTSREILTATYRSGGGEAGNLPAHSLTMLQSHLPHVKGVTNPGLAQGGLPAESAGHGREQAPKRVRALGRIVTLKDYSDFTATFPGVSQSAVRALPEKAPRWIEIAVVPKHDPQSDPTQTDPLLKVLEKAIDRSRSSAILPVKLHPYQPVFFSLGMQLHVSPEIRDDENRKNNLIEAVRKKILERYSLEMQILGRDVTEAEIFQLVQSAHGVTAVTLTRLQKPASEAEEMGISSSASTLTANWDELLLVKAKELEVA